MGSLEFVTGGQVIKLGALDCPGRGCKEYGKRHRDDHFRDASPEHSYRPLVCSRAPEGSRVVTLLALRSEAPGVHVIAGMTRSADHRWLDDVLRSDMAVGTTDFCVCPQQREASVGCMIEVPHLPAIRRVAFAAVLPQAAVVDVILRVTAHAFLWRVIEPLGCMTLPARDDDMQSGERILRLIVIEVHVLPLCSGMALLALLAQGAAVRLIGAMTVDALRTQFLIFGDAGVAHVTVEVRVRAFECKLEACKMIETRDVPHVVSVAIGARGPEPAGMLVV
jgi:hypothetical protein